MRRTSLNNLPMEVVQLIHDRANAHTRTAMESLARRYRAGLRANYPKHRSSFETTPVQNAMWEIGSSQRVNAVQDHLKRLHRLIKSGSRVNAKNLDRFVGYALNKTTPANFERTLRALKKAAGAGPTAESTYGASYPNLRRLHLLGVPVGGLALENTIADMGDMPSRNMSNILKYRLEHGDISAANLNSAVRAMSAKGFVRYRDAWMPLALEAGPSAREHLVREIAKSFLPVADVNPLLMQLLRSLKLKNANNSPHPDLSSALAMYAHRNADNLDSPDLVNVVRAFLRAGADPFKVNDYDESAFHQLVRYHYRTVVDRVEEHPILRLFARHESPHRGSSVARVFVQLLVKFREKRQKMHSALDKLDDFIDDNVENNVLDILTTEKPWRYPSMTWVLQLALTMFDPTDPRVMQKVRTKLNTRTINKRKNNNSNYNNNNNWNYYSNNRNNNNNP